MSKDRFYQPCHRGHEAHCKDALAHHQASRQVCVCRAVGHNRLPCMFLAEHEPSHRATRRVEQARRGKRDREGNATSVPHCLKQVPLLASCKFAGRRCPVQARGRESQGAGGIGCFMPSSRRIETWHITYSIQRLPRTLDPLRCV